MKLVYCHPNGILVESAKSFLASEGIEVNVRNQILGSGVGELASSDCWPELWVKKDSDFDQAKLLISQLTAEEELPDWLCGNCGEKNYASFKLCWNCQHRHK